MSSKGVRHRFKRWIGNRILPDNIAKQYDTPFPVNFAQPFPLSGETPPGSGLAFKFSPYMQFYTKVYGVMPNADFTKYRLIYRNQPDVKARVDKRVNLAVGKGFTIQCDDPEGKEAAEWLNEWARKIKLDLMLSSAGSDMVVYGTAFQEVTWSQLGTPIAPFIPRESAPINPGESSEDRNMRGPLRAEASATINKQVSDESESAIRGPLRPWVDETAICPKCHELTLHGIRQIGAGKVGDAGYTWYGDVNSFAAWFCENPECKTDPTNPQSMPYSSVVSGEQFMTKMAEINGSRYDGQDIKVIQSEPPKDTDTITYVKDLDPLYLRPRADAYGNIFGYYQWINYPPVLLGPSAVIAYRWNIKSWGYETIYGTSDLMPIIRYVDMRTNTENDLAVWIHTYAKPIVHMKLGMPEKPYTDAQSKAFAIAFRARKPGSDIITKGDIEGTIIQAQMGRGTAVIDWLNYLNVMIHNPLGIPDVLMGAEGISAGGGGSNRSTASVTMEDVIVQAELLQKALARPWEQDIFPILLRAQGFPDNVCALYFYFAWRPIFEEDPNTRSQRVVDLRKTAIISTNEARAMTPDQEPIGKDDDRYKPELDDPLFPPPAAPKMGGGLSPEQEIGSPLAPDSSTMPQGLHSGEGIKAQIINNKRVVSSFYP